MLHVLLSLGLVNVLYITFVTNSETEHYWRYLITAQLIEQIKVSYTVTIYYLTCIKNSKTTHYKMRGWAYSSLLDSMYYELIVTKFVVLIWNLSGTVENYKKLGTGSAMSWLRFETRNSVYEEAGCPLDCDFYFTPRSVSYIRFTTVQSNVHRNKFFRCTDSFWVS